MKQFLTTIAFLTIAFSTFAQDRIILKNKKVINNIRLHEENEHWIVYEKDGSLHDLAKSQIYRMETADLETIYFDEPNQNIVELDVEEKEPSIEDKNGEYISNSVQKPITVADYSIIFHYSLLGLIEPEPVIKGDLEFILNPRHSFQQEFGYFLTYNGRDEVQGFITKSELKHFFDKDQKTLSLNPCNGWYISAQFMYKFHKKVTDYSYENYDYDYIKNTYNLETVEVHEERIKTVTGGHCKIGYQKITKYRMVLDMYFGLGLRSKHEKIRSNDERSYRPNNTFSFTTIPSMQGGVKIGYAF